jgi:Sap, sulfolipid-1-addressing protein
MDGRNRELQARCRARHRRTAGRHEPENLILAVAGAAAIAQTGISGAQQAVAYLIFAVIATIGVGAPVVIYFAMGERSQELLSKLKNWMGQHNAVIMSVLCLIIGAKLIGDAISALT